MPLAHSFTALFQVKPFECLEIPPFFPLRKQFHTSHCFSLYLSWCFRENSTQHSRRTSTLGFTTVFHLILYSYPNIPNILFAFSPTTKHRTDVFNRLATTAPWTLSSVLLINLSVCGQTCSTGFSSVVDSSLSLLFRHLFL